MVGVEALKKAVVPLEGESPPSSHRAEEAKAILKVERHVMVWYEGVIVDGTQSLDI